LGELFSGLLFCNCKRPDLLRVASLYAHDSHEVLAHLVVAYLLERGNLYGLGRLGAEDASELRPATLQHQARELAHPEPHHLLGLQLVAQLDARRLAGALSMGARLENIDLVTLAFALHRGPIFPVHLAKHYAHLLGRGSVGGAAPKLIS